LSQPEHRITFHFTPRHASWLNQIENLVLHPGAKAPPSRQFACKKALRTKIQEFIAYFNRTMASLSVGLTRVNLSPEPPERQMSPSISLGCY